MRFTAGLARFLDRYAGLFGCFLLAFFKKRAGGAVPDRPEKILVIKFWEAGVIVMGAPYFRALRRKFKQAKIVFLTLDVNSEICGMLGAADEIIGLRISAGILVFIRDFLCAMPRLVRGGFDCVLDLEFLSRFTAVITGIIDAKMSLGYYWPGYWRGAAHWRTVLFNPAAHMCGNYTAFFSALGVAPETQDFGPLEFSLEGPGAGLASGKFVAVNLDKRSIVPERNWPQARFAELVRRLAAERPDYRLALVSSRPDREPVFPDLSNLADMRGRLDFRQLAGLLKNASLFITQDSGPMHIADAMGAPVLALFGPETPASYGPVNAKSRALYKNPGCSPCMDVFNGKKVRCVKGKNICMERITVGDALSAALEMLP